MAFGLSVKIGADISGLKKGLNDAQSHLAGFGKSIKPVLNELGLLSTFAVGAAAALGVSLVKSAIEAGGKIYDLSVKTGASTEALSQYGYVAKQTGTDLEALANAWAKQSKNIGDAVRGQGEAGKSLKQLGLDVEKLAQLKPEDQFEAIATQLEKVHDQSIRLSLADDIWGRGGSAAALQAMDGGVQKIRQLRAEADKLGLTLNADQAAKLEAVGDAVDQMRGALQGAANEIAINAGPALVEFINTLATNMPPAITGAIKGLNRISVGYLSIKESIQEALVWRDEWDEKIIDAAGFGDVDGFKRKNETLIRHRNELNDTKQAIGKLQESYISLDAARSRTFSVTPGKGMSAITGQPNIKTGTSGANKGLDDFGPDYEKEFDAYQDFLTNRRKARIDDFESQEDLYKSEEMIAAEHYAKQAMMVQDAMAEGLVSQDKGNAAMLYLENKLMNDLATIRQAGLSELEKFNQLSWGKQAETIFGEMESITAGVTQHNKALFRINQIAGISNAIISAHEGISKTLAKYPYPISIGMAALQAAAAFAQVAAIKNAKYGSGSGSAPSLAGGTAAPPVSNVGGRTGQTLFLEPIDPNALFSGIQVSGLVDRINQFVKDGGKVVATSVMS